MAEVGYILSFVRIAAILSFLPMLGLSLWEWRLRIVLAGLVTIIIMPSVHISSQVNLSHALIWELGIGLVLGFSLQLLIQLFVMIGKSIGTASGLSFAKIIEPIQGMPETVMMQFFALCGVFMFFQLDLHHVVIFGLKHLFAAIPVGQGDAIPTLIDKVGHALIGHANQIIWLIIPFVSLLGAVFLSVALLGRYKFEFNTFMLGLPLLLLMAFLLLSIKIDNILLVLQSIMMDYTIGIFG